jgi:YbbR domain-containing protein
MALNVGNVSLTGGDVAITLDEVVFPATIDLQIDFSLEKKIPVIPDISAQADEGFAVTGAMNPLPDEVILVGPRSKVQSIGSIKTVHKELSGLRNNIVLYLPLVELEGRDMEVRPDSVEVTVEVVPIKTRVFDDIPIVVFNAPGDRKIYTDPAAISVELTGSPNEIDQLDRFSIIVSADYHQLAADGYAPLKIECPSKFMIKGSSVKRARIGFQQ